MTKSKDYEKKEVFYLTLLGIFISTTALSVAFILVSNDDNKREFDLSTSCSNLGGEYKAPNFCTVKCHKFYTEPAGGIFAPDTLCVVRTIG
jgi:hypothetical protein